MPPLTEVQQFYSNKVIFITGATGFLGRLLIEKLLRTCPDVQRVYILLRVTKEALSDRLQKLLEDEVFNVLRKLNPKFSQKIIGVAGDVCLPNLGLSSDDQYQLKNSVHIIFHTAASTNYNMKLSRAIDINIRATFRLLELSRTWSKLQCFMHSSSILAIYDEEVIEDKLYLNINPPVSWRTILEDKEVDEKQDSITGNAPNTYVYTKRQCEIMLSELKGNVNIGIIRPGGFTSTAYEPEPGWLGKVGIGENIVILMALGLLRVIKIDPEGSANSVPADMHAHATLVCAWHTYRTYQQNPSVDIPVYNHTATAADLTMGEVMKSLATEISRNPLPGIISTNVLQESDPKAYLVLNLLLNKLPGYLGQLFYDVVGVPSTMKETVDLAQWLLEIFTKVLDYSWNASCPNLNIIWNELSEKDKELWLFHIPNVNWEHYNRRQYVQIRKLAEELRLKLQNLPQIKNSKL